MDKYRPVLEGAMQSLVPDESVLFRLLRYHMDWADAQGRAVEGDSGGKALRPTLCFLTCEALGAPWPRVAVAAATLELIHNFTLIHDDIQDMDLERRGRPTVWSVWGVGQALWTGNAMRVLSDRALILGDTSAYLRRQADHLLTESYLEIIEGQYMDLEFEGRPDVRVVEYLDMISRKTGALLRCSVEMGALLATEDTPAKAALRQWAERLGRAFQVRDDILGIWGDPARTGKPVGNDIRRKKRSYPIVYGLEHAGEAGQEALRAAYAAPALEEAQVQTVMAVLEDCDAYRHAQGLVDAESERALEALDLAAEDLTPWGRQQMVQLTCFLARRDR